MSDESTLATRLQRLAQQSFEEILTELTERDPLDLCARVAAAVAREGLWVPDGLALAKVRRAVARALAGASLSALDAAWLTEQVRLAAHESTNHAATSNRDLTDAWRALADRAAARFGMPPERGLDVLTRFHGLARERRCLLLAGMAALQRRESRALTPADWQEFDQVFRGLVRELIQDARHDLAP